MICAFFSKDFAVSFLRAVRHGKPFAPPPDPVSGQREWTANNMLSLAGLLFAASRKDSCDFHEKGIVVSKRFNRPVDRERMLAIHCAELHSALDFLSSVAFAVWDGDYPASWEPDMTGYIDEEDVVQEVPVLRIFDDEKKRRC